jgi:predicted metal-dependent phosphoesterase TrpH
MQNMVEMRSARNDVTSSAALEKPAPPAAHLRKYFLPAELPGLASGMSIGDDGREVEGVIYRNVTVAEESGYLYLVSHKAILTANLTPVCNANCQFCFNGITFFPFKDHFDDEVQTALHRTLRFASHAGVRSISLSGGEPTLVPALLLRTLDQARRQFDGFIRLHTNSSRLWRPYRNGATRPLVDWMEDYGLTDLSISRMSEDEARNDALMRMPAGSTPGPAQIRDLARRFPSLRLSCFISQDAVADHAAMLRYLDWGLALGVRRYTFRLASGIDNLFSVPGAFQRGNSEFQGPTTESLARVLEGHGFAIEFQRQCEDYDLFVLRRGDIEVSVDRSSDVADPDLKVRRLVFMPNGACYSSWVQGSSTLFPDERQHLVAQARRGPVKTDGKYPAASSRRNLYTRRQGEGVDLHIHSQVSDGLLTPSAVIEKVAAAGIHTAVFTEHNALHDDPESLRRFAADKGVDLSLMGVEASTLFTRSGEAGGFKFHLLMYGEGLASPDVQAWLDKAVEPRRAHALRLYHDLCRAGVPLPAFEDIYAVKDSVPGLSSRKKMFTRGPLAMAIATALDVTPDEAKQKWLPAVPHAENDQGALDIRDALRVAKRYGLCTVLAHPGWVRPLPGETRGDFEGVLDVILDLAGEGLDGVEIRHRHNDLEHRDQLLRLAQMTDLLVTGGSDFHGKPKCELGKDGTTRDELARLLERVANKRAAVVATVG